MQNTGYDKDVVFSHIDKVYSTLSKCWDSSYTMLSGGLLTSLILITLSGGLLSFDEKLEFGGVAFKIPLSIFMIGGALITSYFFFMFFALEDRATRLKNEIIELYNNIGYKEEALKNPLISPFDTPILFSIIGNFLAGVEGYVKQPRNRLTQIIDLINAIFIILTFAALPLGAEIYAGIKMIIIFGWQWWIVTAFVVSIVSFLSGFVSFILRSY